MRRYVQGGGGLMHGWMCLWLGVKENFMFSMKKYEKNMDLNGLIKCELCGGKSHLKKDCPKYKYI